MNPVDIIRNKRDKKILSQEEIAYFINGIINGEIADYQISAFTMAVYINGMNEDELYYLTKYMAGGTEEAFDSNFVDKHSTGGIGDKITLIIAPLIAKAGLKMAKMSGRGLGFSGGTVDKLESIPGFSTSLSKVDLKKQIEDIGFAIIGQSEEIALADKKIYSIRDVTGTVESIPLIASSIVSKKIASGNRNIVFDVKVGSGAFMKTIEEGRLLGKTLVELIKKFGGKAVAVITDMNSPLGHYVGNSLEIIEVMETLKGNGPADLIEVSKVIGGILLHIGNLVENQLEGELIIEEMLEKALGLERFAEFIKAQGGLGEVVYDYDLLPKADISFEVSALKSGFISSINSESIGELSVELGAGRRKKEDKIDYGAGIFIPKKTGDYVEAGDIIGILYTSKENIDRKLLSDTYRKAFTLAEEKAGNINLIYDIII